MDAELGVGGQPDRGVAHQGDGVHQAGGVTGDDQDQFVGVQPRHLAASGQGATDLLGQPPEHGVVGEGGLCGLQGTIDVDDGAAHGGVGPAGLEPGVQSAPCGQTGGGIGRSGTGEVPQRSAGSAGNVDGRQVDQRHARRIGTFVPIPKKFPNFWSTSPGRWVTRPTDRSSGSVRF